MYRVPRPIYRPPPLSVRDPRVGYFLWEVLCEGGVLGGEGCVVEGRVW